MDQIANNIDAIRKAAQTILLADLKEYSSVSVVASAESLRIAHERGMYMQVYVLIDALAASGEVFAEALFKAVIDCDFGHETLIAYANKVSKSGDSDESIEKTISEIFAFESDPPTTQDVENFIEAYQTNRRAS